MNGVNEDQGLPNFLSDRRMEETVACVSRGASREGALRHTPTKFCTKHSTTLNKVFSKNGIVSFIKVFLIISAGLGIVEL